MMALLVNSGVVVSADDAGLTPLMQAAREGRAEMVDYLLTVSVDVDRVDDLGRSAAQHALGSGSEAVVRSVLRRGGGGARMLDDASGVNAVAECVSGGQWGLVRAAVESVVQPAAVARGRDARGRTVLRALLEAGEATLLARLAPHADPAAVDPDGLMLLHRAAAVSASATEMLVTTAGHDPRARDARGRDALMHAAEASNHDAVAFLLPRCRDAPPDAAGRTPLMAACARADVRIVEALLPDAYPRARTTAAVVDSRRRTPAHYAAAHARPANIRALASRGFHLDAADADGVTPLLCACSVGDARTLVALLRRGATADITDRRKRGALHYCACAATPSLRCVQMALRCGVDANAADDTGRTPLMLACETCARAHISVITCLLDGEANPVRQDDEGRDAFDYCSYDCEYVKAAMRQRGGASTITVRCGGTPMAPYSQREGTMASPYRQIRWRRGGRCTKSRIGHTWDNS